MALRLGARGGLAGLRRVGGGRAMSSMVTIERDSEAKTATLSMNRPPANSLSLEFMSELRAGLKELEGDPAVRGIVLDSTNPKIL